MDKEQRKARRIEFVPPLPIKRQIDKLPKGERSHFIIEAVKEKLDRMRHYATAK